MSDKEAPSSPDPPEEKPNEEDSQQDASASNPKSTSETRSRGSFQKFVSKIVAPSPRRVHEGTFTPPTNRTPPSLTMGVSRNDAMYERSKLRLVAKEQRLKETEKKLMEECTFTPETNRSKSSSNSGNTSVFDRLYSESRKTTPQKYNGRRGDSQKRSPTSVSSHGSSRIEYLYQDGLRRAQNRKLTDREEAEERRRRLEEKELKECTFRPNMDWRKKKPVHVHEKHKDLAYSHSPRYQYSPPVHVVMTQPISARNVGGHKSGRNHSIVSPLRGPDIPSHASAPSCIESLGDGTEYGSI